MHATLSLPAATRSPPIRRRSLQTLQVNLGDQCNQSRLHRRLGPNKGPGTIHPYPTPAEADKSSAGEWQRAHAPKKLLPWVGRFHGRERT